jgi:hypothetical protein
MSVAPNPVVTVNGPGSDPLQLGGVTFASDECPSGLAIGGLEQMVVVHDLIGGGRTTQALGVKPKAVGWSGTFWDQNVQGRVATLRAYAVSGTDLPISWRNESYFGVVKEFEPTYENAWICHYRIAIEITGDANGAFTNTTPPSVDDVVSSESSDLGTQNANLQTADPAGSSAMQQSITNMLQAIQTAGPLAQVTGTALTTLVGTVNVAQQAVQAYVSTADPTSQNYVTASRMLSLVTLIGANIGRSQSTATVQRFGGSLYEVATMQYGDIKQTFALAAANGLNTPSLTKTALSTVTIPPLPKST